MYTAISINVVGSKLQAHKTRPKRNMRSSYFVFLGATGKMKENTVNVCLRTITLVVEEFKAETFARKTTLASSRILRAILILYVFCSFFVLFFFLVSRF